MRDLKRAAAEGAKDPINVVTVVTGLDRSKIGLAATYYAAYPGDIDEHIRMEEEAALRLRRALGVDSAA